MVQESYVGAQKFQRWVIFVGIYKLKDKFWIVLYSKVEALFKAKKATFEGIKTGVCEPPEAPD